MDMPRLREKGGGRGAFGGAVRPRTVKGRWLLPPQVSYHENRLLSTIFEALSNSTLEQRPDRFVRSTTACLYSVSTGGPPAPGDKKPVRPGHIQSSETQTFGLSQPPLLEPTISIIARHCSKIVQRSLQHRGWEIAAVSVAPSSHYCIARRVILCLVTF